MDKKKLYEKWMWTELIAFDKHTPDFSVKKFLDNAGFIPDAIALFLFSPNFIHFHQGIEREIIFPTDFCAYRKLSNTQKKVQNWTNYQLKGLINELHKYGIHIYCSVFSWPFSISASGGKIIPNEWTEKHPELIETTKTGAKGQGWICPLLRFKDNTYYEDFFIKKAAAVMTDYEFDGFHLGDGYNSSVLPIYLADYSDDMVDQFVQVTGVKFPAGIRKQCGARKESINKRADWIWQNKRCEWINFYAGRWENFFRKVVNVLHKQGKKVAANNSCTREPFQSLYRYGVDYKTMADAGIDIFMPETVSTGITTEYNFISKPPERNFLYDSLATVLLMKAYTPKVPMIGLNGIRDIAEQWDNLAHAPTALEREIYSLSNLYWYDSRGKLNRCFGGPLFCLADDIKSYEWQWLQKRWDLGFSFNPKRIMGVTLVWSDRAFERQLEDFTENRRWTTHRIVYELMSRGVPVNAVVNVKDVSRLAGADLLVTNPHLYPKEELKSILSYKKGAVIMIGAKTPGLPKSSFQVEDVYQPSQMFCGVYGRTKKGCSVTIKKNGEENIPGNLKKIVDPEPWFTELYFRKVSNRFLEACTQVISDCTDSFVKLEFKAGEREPKPGTLIKVSGVEGETGILRLFIGNDSFRNAWARIDVGKQIDRVEVVTEFPFPGAPLYTEGSKFDMKVPPRGMVVVDIKVKNQPERKAQKRRRSK